jgi:hypothetical protein
MVTPAHKINFPLTEAEVKAAIQKTMDNPAIISRDNLRYRRRNIKFDCLLRGYVGEYAISKWFEQNGIEIEATNNTVEGETIDIDFYYREKNIELKTSLVPDRDGNIDTAINTEDIKLIRRGTETIDQLRGDIHLQVYFTQLRAVKDTWLNAQVIDITSRNVQYLYDSFHAVDYRTMTFFVAWIDKPTLVARINALPNNIGARTWEFGQRLFWNCKIRDSKPPAELIAYLNAL